MRNSGKPAANLWSCEGATNVLESGRHTPICAETQQCRRADAAINTNTAAGCARPPEVNHRPLICESTGHGKRERQTAEATPSRHFPASKPGGNGPLHAACETASLLVERYLFSRLRVFRQGVNRYWKNCIERLFIRLLEDKVVFPGPWLQDCALQNHPPIIPFMGCSLPCGERFPGTKSSSASWT